MIRATPLFAALAVLAMAVPAGAQPNTLRAEFATSFERATEVIVDGRLWSCADTACTARGDDPRPAIACRKLARKTGPVTRFATPRSELDAAGLATCNQDRQ
jgi:hypothetical protein